MLYEIDRFVKRAVEAMLMFAAIIVTLAAGTPAASAADADVVTVRVPEGGIQPQARVDERGRIHLIFVTGDPKRGDVHYSRSDDGAKTFSKPIRINSQPNSVIAIGTIRGPHLAVGKGGRVHVAWMGSDKAEPKGANNSVPMLYARMNDAGDAFESQRNLISRRAGLDGGGSVAADAEGNVYVAWHAPDNPRQHEEEKRHIWVVRSGDEGRTFDEETAANPTPTGVCGCCGMRVFADHNGNVLALYRSATAMVNRDIFLLASKDKGKSFTAENVGPWRVGKCVMSTASLVEGPRGALLAAWEQEEQVYTSRLDPTTLKPSEPQPLSGTGKNPKHPVAAFDANGRSVVAWTEGTGWNKGGDVAWQVFDPLGRPVTGSKGRVNGLPTWSVPAVVPGPGGQFIVIY